MTLVLELSERLEQKLSNAAARAGLPVDQYALRLLEEEPASEHRPANGAELVAYWQREGVIGSRPEIQDSQVYARELRCQAERRPRS